MGLSVGIFRNFRNCFRIVRVEFREYFRTVRVEFFGLFLDSPDRIFGTVFEQSETVLRFGFDPRTDVFRFCCVWCHNNLVTNREGTKKCLVLYGSEILTILCVIIRKKINNMLLCVKIMLIGACVMY